MNTARGDLIDEEAMIRALEKGKVWSLGLDVFDNEPGVDERFLGSERVVVCPHIGAATVETMVSSIVYFLRFYYLSVNWEMKADEIIGCNGTAGH